MIKIARITIKNFRQLKEIDLKFNDSKGVFLFTGDDQGVGKSNFMNAITWCLYEEEPFKTEKRNMGIINELVANNLGAFAEVTILINGDKKQLQIKRRQKRNQASTLEVLSRNKDNNWAVVKEDPVLQINGFLPKSVSDFFLFDGESVLKIFDIDSALNLKRGILKVSHVEVLDSAISQLSSLITELRRDTSRGEPNLNAVKEAIDERTNRVSKNEILLESCKADLDVAKKNQNDYIGRQIEITKYSEQVKRRDLILEEIESVKNQLEDIVDHKNNIIILYAKYAIAQDTISKFIEKIKTENTNSNVKPDVSNIFIKNLIESKVCICDHHIGHKEEEALNKIVLQSKIDDKKKFLSDESATLEPIMKSEIIAHAYNFERLIKQETDLNDSLAKNNLRLKEVSEELLNSSNSDVSSLQYKIESANLLIEETNNKIFHLNNEITEDKKQLDRENAEFSRLLGNVSSFKREAERLRISINLKDKIEKIHDVIVAKVRNDLNAHTFIYFKELMKDKGKYKVIEFNDNYQVTALKEGSSDNTFSSFSKGERKVLGFATLKALGEQSGFSEVPVFIDAPFEYLSENVQNNLLDSIKSFMPNKQLFLFTHEKTNVKAFADKEVPISNRYEFKVEIIEGSRATTIVNVGGESNG